MSDPKPEEISVSNFGGIRREFKVEEKAGWEEPTYPRLSHILCRPDLPRYPQILCGPPYPTSSPKDRTALPVPCLPLSEEWGG